MLSEILNPFINVRNKVRTSTGWEDLKKEEESLYTSHGLRSIPDKEIFEIWGKKVIIDSLHYASTEDVYPKLLINKTDNDWVGEILHIGFNSGDSTGRTYPKGESIKINGSPYLENIYTSDNGISVICLKRPIILPNGGKFLFTGDGNVTYNMSYRVVD